MTRQSRFRGRLGQQQEQWVSYFTCCMRASSSASAQKALFSGAVHPVQLRQTEKTRASSQWVHAAVSTGDHYPNGPRLNIRTTQDARPTSVVQSGRCATVLSKKGASGRARPTSIGTARPFRLNSGTDTPLLANRDAAEVAEGSAQQEAYE